MHSVLTAPQVCSAGYVCSTRHALSLGLTCQRSNLNEVLVTWYVGYVYWIRTGNRKTLHEHQVGPTMRQCPTQEVLELRVALEAAAEVEAEVEEGSLSVLEGVQADMCAQSIARQRMFEVDVSLVQDIQGSSP